MFHALDDAVVGLLVVLGQRLDGGRVVGLRGRRVPRELQQRGVHHQLLRLHLD